MQMDSSILPAIILWQIITEHKEKHVIAWCIAAIFVSVAVPFSLHDIHMHTLHVRASLPHASNHRFDSLPVT